ncbi:energy transducer TonB [Flavobacterium gilvum]|uniref:TonB C-terminal domain-containing protein n=1 Tax=Flavobacterium gilvum TaxID=1492737 RepID=A0AAC9N3B3_9FLAO|nr:energy transducer TonB [Flavobacterium gilvum]AOW08485.1 hypothetical protein EM308_02665 [Flavobacterium gilvum]KFC58202.1 hypothetical protein FEM08_29720 [Flavobacterium gilvum]
MSFRICSIGAVPLLLLLIFSTKAIAQEESKKNDVIEKEIFPTWDIDARPEFPGSIESFNLFVVSNFKMPPEAVKNKVKGKIYMSFIVEKDGSLSGFKVIRDIGYGTGEEAIRVLKLSPKWIPGSNKGVIVRTIFYTPIPTQVVE